MGEYKLVQWILFFFLYCFAGWLWECFYVSAKEKKWVNRGFLNGPFLPIYGFGAVIVLMITLPFQESIVGIFLAGMAGATVLEYATGYVMERLFLVKYWDYSEQPFNLDGYICLGCSLGWGVFSVLLVKLIHYNLAKLVLGIPYTIALVISILMLIYFVVDVTMSVNEALKLRDIIRNYIENSEEIQRLQRRVDVLLAILDDDSSRIQQKLAESRQQAEAEIEQLREDVRKRLEVMEMHRQARQKAALHILRRNPHSISKKYMLKFEEIKRIIEEGRHE